MWILVAGAGSAHAAGADASRYNDAEASSLST